MTTYRELVLACSRGGTYKYFVPRAQVGPVWRRLQDAYGPIVRNDTMKTMQIEARRLVFRSTLLANPITVIRKRLCTDQDIARMHVLVGYEETSDADLHR